MHQVKRSSINVNILLNSCALCLLLDIETRSIFKSEHCSHSEVNKFKSNWHHDVELHGSSDGSTDIAEPLSIEIRVLSLHVKKFNNTNWELSGKIGSTEHWKNTSVKELTNKNNVGNKLQFDRFGIASAIAHDQGNNSSNHIIDDDDQIFDGSVLKSGFGIFVNESFTH